ncbi:MAG: DUF4350 domain-containing protein [Gemmatimonadales bacterium]
MRPRTELALGAGFLLALGIGAAALGSRRAVVLDLDPRRSTYLAGPSGARGFAEAAQRLGVEVVRYRRPTGRLDSLPARSGRTLIAVLGASLPIDPEEGRRLAEVRHDLLLAGRATTPAMRCLGYTVLARSGDPASTRLPGGRSGRMPTVRAELVRHLARTVVDSSSPADGAVVTCDVPPALRTDTLLQTTGGRPVVLRLALEGLALEDSRTAILVADDRLFSNRALRETEAGPLALGLVVPRYQRLVVDEFHHGYATSGSLAGAALDWSLGSPWGWAVWQLAAVGVLALLASAVRFGPVRNAIERRRRSPLEHVRALATALAAARGHDVAVSLMVQGLRRRLSRTGRPARGDLQSWLESLTPSVRTPRGREALAALTTLTRRQPSAEGVREAANAVETLWEELKPS